MSVPFRTRGVAGILLALLVSGALPVSTFAAALASPCATVEHRCDAPAIERCCCLESTGTSVPATTQNGPEISNAPAMTATGTAAACGLAFVFPPEAWFRVCSRTAGPPLPLHLLNVSIRR